MIRVFGAPQRYVQGPGALDELGRLAAELGKHPVVVLDAAVRDLFADRVAAIMAAAGCRPEFLVFGGECTLDEIGALAARVDRADPVIALGGGKAIDTAKGVALHHDSRLIVVPTIASNDSPTSRLIVHYTADHAVAGVKLLPRNPDIVLVDTAVVVKAPLRFFVAGIGDALSKRFEVGQCHASGGKNFYGTRPLAVAVRLAEMCYDTIRAHGLAACAAVKRQEVTADVEAVTEATVLWSGLGFESGGLSIAHAMVRGLTAIPQLAHFLHGEMVAYGTLVQLAVEGHDDAALLDHIGFWRALGLPAALADLGLAEPTPAHLATIAEATLGAPYAGHVTVPLSAPILVAGIARVDALART